MKPLLAAFLILAITQCLAVLPTEPAAFGARAVTPVLAYSFPQDKCVTGPFPADVTPAALPLTRDPVNTACLTRTVNGNVFNAAKVGVKNAVLSSSETLKSAAAHATFAPWTVAADNTVRKKMTIEMWITPQVAPATTTYLLELGGTGTATNNAGIAVGQYQLLISYQGGSLIARLYTFNQIDVQSEKLVSFENSLDFVNVVSSMSEPANFGIPYYLAITIDGSQTSSNVFAYIAKKGEVALATDESTISTFIRNVGEGSDAILRVGTARGVDGTAKGAFPGEINFLAFHDVVLNPTQIKTLFDAGLPNSNPVLRDSTLVLNEGSPFASSLFGPNDFYDANNNTITQIKIQSEASNKLRYDGAALSPFPFEVTDLSKLTFEVDAATPFSHTGDGACTEAYGTFAYTASDGLCSTGFECFSPEAKTATVCIKDVYSAPVHIGSLEVLKTGTVQFFSLDASDADDGKSTVTGNVKSVSRFRETGTTGTDYASTSKVVFAAPDNANGAIYQVATDGTCTMTKIAANADNSAVLYTDTSTKAFRFCFRAKTTADATFAFTYKDAKATSASYNLKFVQAVSACASTSGTSVNTGGAFCQSSGMENLASPGTVSMSTPGLTLVYLEGKHYQNLNVEYKITELPANGKLFRVLGTSSAQELETVALSVGDVVSRAAATGFPNLAFLGDANYFTRVDASTYKNLDGEPFNGCALDVAPGCPITFKFVAKVGAVQSPEATYSIHLDSQLSALTVATVPTSVVVSATATAVSGVTLSNLDQGAYKVGVRITATQGKLSLAVTPEFLTASADFTPEICLEMTGCDVLAFKATHAKAKTALEALQIADPTGAVTSESYIRVQAYANADLESTTPDAKLIELTPAGSSTSGPTDISDPSTIDAAVVGGAVGGSVGGLCLMVLIAYLCCRSATRKVLEKANEDDVEIGATRNKKKLQTSTVPPTDSVLAPVAASTPKAASSAAPAAAAEEESVFSWEKHIDQRTGDVYFFNPKTGQSQWDPPTIKGKTGK